MTSQRRQIGARQWWHPRCARRLAWTGQGTFMELLSPGATRTTRRAVRSASADPELLRLNLPNARTLLRSFLVPFLVVVLLTKFDGREIVALAIFLTATATDFLDGWLARRRGEITTLGTLLDPIADKLLISAAFISLVELGLVPAWMVVVVVGREFAVTGLLTIASDQGVVIAASGWGKA